MVSHFSKQSYGMSVSTGFASTSSASQQPDLRRLSQTASSAHLQYDRLACGPAWASPGGGSQILIAASVIEQKAARDPGGHVQVMFDQTEVGSFSLSAPTLCVPHYRQY